MDIVKNRLHIDTDKLMELNPEFKILPEETKQIKIINRLNDALFKYIFGREENKPILISFLNSILEDEGKRIVDLDYLDREASPKFEGGKGCRFDVRARVSDGRIFHVEVQIGEDVDFFERCLFYACDSYANQLRSGQIYKELMPLIFVGVLGYEQFHGNNVYSHYMLLETERHEVGTDALEFHFFELPKLKHSNDISGRKFYRWLRYLSNSSRKDKELEEDVMIAEALKAEELFLANPESRFRYMQAELEKYLSAKRENFFISKGEAKGEAKGKLENKLENARKMLADGVSVDNIARWVGLSEREVAKILKNSK